jgi:nicotinamidase-related amidase
MLIDAERSMLLVIDMQEKMLPALAGRGRLLENVVWLVRAAQKIGVPVAASEHCPKSLGPTVTAIRALLPPAAVGHKHHFSCVAAQCLTRLPGVDRPQAILAGGETHVCVLQTALELVEEGKEVYVVADCTSSRREFDRDLALARLRQEGVRIVTREMVVFEWLGEAATPLFGEIRKEFFGP